MTVGELRQRLANFADSRPVALTVAIPTFEPASYWAAECTHIDDVDGGGGAGATAFEFVYISGNLTRLERN